MKKAALSFFVFMVAFGFTAPKAFCGDVQIQPIFNQSGLWDSNPLMLAHGRETIYGSTTSPKLALTNETLTSRAKIEAWVDQNLFNDSKYNSTDLHARADLEHHNERWEARLRGGTDYDTTRTSELTNFGRDVGKVRRFAYNIGPEIAFKATQRDELSLAGSFNRSVYKSDDYSDYSVISLSPTYIRSLTPLTSALLTIQAQRFQSEGLVKRRVDSIGPSTGFRTELAPTLSLRMSGGSQASRERLSGQDAQSWKWHYVYSAELTLKGEEKDLTLAASRTRTPFSNGTDALLTTFSLNFAHKLHERLKLSTSASYQMADYDEEQTNDLDDMLSGQIGLSYTLTESFDIETNYQHRNERLTSGDRAQRHIARLGLTYRPVLGGGSF